MTVGATEKSIVAPKLMRMRCATTSRKLFTSTRNQSSHPAVVTSPPATSANRPPPRPASQPPSGPARVELRFERSEEHTSELQSLMRISYAVFCLKKKTTQKKKHRDTT